MKVYITFWSFDNGNDFDEGVIGIYRTYEDAEEAGNTYVSTNFGYDYFVEAWELE